MSGEVKSWSVQTHMNFITLSGPSGLKLGQHLVLKSDYEKVVKALKHYALANGASHPSGNVAREALKELGEL